MTDDTNNGVPFVRITNREVFDKLSHLDQLVSRMDSRLNAILEENVLLGKRVRSLELKTYAILAGFSTALSAAGLWLIGHLGGGG